MFVLAGMAEYLLRAIFFQGNWVSSPKDTVFPETIPEESSSTEEEHVVSYFIIHIGADLRRRANEA